MSNDLSERLSEIRERVEAATEGPWDMVPASEGKRAVVGHLPPENVRIADVGDRGTSVEERNDDAAFIASARSDVPYLLSLVEAIPGDEVLAAAQTAVDAQLGEWKERAERHHRNGSDEGFAEKKVHELREAKEALADLKAALRDAAQKKQTEDDAS